MGPEECREKFDDVIWSDETNVQMELTGDSTATKGVENLDTKLTRSILLKFTSGQVYISCKGATGVCIFDGIMDAPMYTRILENYLKPFIRDVYPTGHRFMQDNDPKHMSRHTQQFFVEHSINWWKTPPESPDANPIENLWHELTHYTRECVNAIFRVTTIMLRLCNKFTAKLLENKASY